MFIGLGVGAVVALHPNRRTTFQGSSALRDAGLQRHHGSLECTQVLVVPAWSTPAVALAAPLNFKGCQ